MQGVGQETARGAGWSGNDPRATGRHQAEAGGDEQPTTREQSTLRFRPNTRHSLLGALLQTPFFSGHWIRWRMASGSIAATLCSS